jgi:hypothetical protein
VLTEGEVVMQKNNPFFLFMVVVFVSLLSNFSNASDMFCNGKVTISERAESSIVRIANNSLLANPMPLSILKTEGLLPGEGIRDESLASRRDFDKILLLAFAWRSTQKEVYLLKIKEFLLDWSLNYKPSLNPIDETQFSKVFQAYGVVRSDLDSQSRDSIDKWVRIFANGYLNELIQNHNKKNSQYSNWQSHRIKLAISSAAALNNPEMVNSILPFFKEQVERNIRNDGSTEDFHIRDSISYSVYSLTPLVESAILIKKNNNKWLNENEEVLARLLNGVDWLKPYVTGAKIHQEYINSKVRFDRIRAEKEIDGHKKEKWKPLVARDLFWLVSYLKSDNVNYAKILNVNPSAILEACYGLPK